MPNPLQAQHMQAILQAADTLIDETITFLQGMIRIPTINPPGNMYPECAHYIGEHLQALGYAVEYIDLTADEIAELAPYGGGMPRSNVIGRLQGQQHTPVMHFNGHMDVV